MNKYIGHETQVYGVEEHRLIGGKGDGQRLYEIHNGVGLDLTVSPDRAGDITRLRYKGINMNFMSAAGYARPAYYDHVGAGFLKAFTAGFLTTCGFENVGSPNGDQGDEVMNLQIALNQLGYSTGGTDGKYGTRTENAVRKFQKANGLDTDGLAGAETQRVLYSEEAKAKPEEGQ